MDSVYTRYDTMQQYTEPAAVFNTLPSFLCSKQIGEKDCLSREDGERAIFTTVCSLNKIIEKRLPLVGTASLHHDLSVNQPRPQGLLSLRSILRHLEKEVVSKQTNYHKVVFKF